jgi:hypothetical protein
MLSGENKSKQLPTSELCIKSALKTSCGMIPVISQRQRAQLVL